MGQARNHPFVDSGHNSLPSCEMRKTELGWKAQINEDFSTVMKQLACMNSWDSLQGNTRIIFFS